ncbi:MAG TPA: diaminopimelate epimerase [Thermoanaerobaculia bacterium]|nr:diaminopimelate epimerase [Thermoanaerobaculia bacterium]
MPSFYLVSGAGNDFIALPEPERPPTSEEIRAWCRRGISVGSDGLFVLRRAAGAKAGPAVTMDYFNGDGRAADLCINGTRCAARLAFELGWADGEVEIDTGAGPVRARRLAESVIGLELPRPEAARELAPEVDGRPWPGLFLRVGVPHFVLPWPAPLGEAPVATLGPTLRHHPAMGPAGTNVDFVRYPAPDRLEVRSFERGVEAETLACGTGVLAAAAAGLARGMLRLPATALTTGGFEMTVAAVGGDGSDGADGATDRPPADGSRPRHWTLAGDARLVARGELLPEASRAPQPPRWSPAR